MKLIKVVKLVPFLLYSNAVLAWHCGWLLPFLSAPGANRRTGQVQEICGGGWPERKTAGSYEGWHLQYWGPQEAQRYLLYSSSTFVPPVLLQQMCLMISLPQKSTLPACFLQIRPEERSSPRTLKKEVRNCRSLSSSLTSKARPGLLSWSSSATQISSTRRSTTKSR